MNHLLNQILLDMQLKYRFWAGMALHIYKAITAMEKTQIYLFWLIIGFRQHLNLNSVYIGQCVSKHLSSVSVNRTLTHSEMQYWK